MPEGDVMLITIEQRTKAVKPMKTITKLLLLVGALALSACNNPDRFGAGGAGGAAGTGGITQGGLGDPNDPNSPAYFAQTIGDRVNFAVDQSTLTAEAQTVLAAQAAWMNQHPEYTAIIEGHADEVGTREYNLALGERRANAIKSFLTAAGVASSQIETVSYGEERPENPGHDESAWSRNRRGIVTYR